MLRTTQVLGVVIPVPRPYCQRGSTALETSFCEDRRTMGRRIWAVSLQGGTPGYTHIMGALEHRDGVAELLIVAVRPQPGPCTRR